MKQPPRLGDTVHPKFFFCYIVELHCMELNGNFKISYSFSFFVLVGYVVVVGLVFLGGLFFCLFVFCFFQSSIPRRSCIELFFLEPKTPS